MNKLIFKHPVFKFENRVFKNELVHFGRTEGYQLTFEIPHTEYPKESAGGVNE